MNKISIIIPVFNEAKNINQLLSHLEQSAGEGSNLEIIIVDGGSCDGIAEIIKTYTNVHFIESEKGRAKQMNAGAKMARGAILYFLHCDSFPPKNFDLLIQNEVDRGNKAGCFKMQFDYGHPVLRISQWFTRFNHLSCRGGDQSLFITKDLFEEINGFNAQLIIYEDNEIISRLYQQKQFTVIQKSIITSARRYRKNGVWRLQYHFFMIHIKYRLGHSPESMLQYYRKKIK